MEKIQSFQITGMNIAGFKSYQESTDLTFGNPTVITGGNGRGKTSIADAIAFAVTGLPFFGERGIDRLHNEIQPDVCITMHFVDEVGCAHVLIRARHKNSMTILYDGYEIRQMDLTELFGEKDVFLSIFNPLYFIEELGNDGKNLLERHLPTIPHETVMAQLSDGVRNALAGENILVPETYLKKKREEIRELEESIIYLRGQQDQAQSQGETQEQAVTRLEGQLHTLNQELTALEAKRFDGLDRKTMEQQLVDLSARYDEAARDGSPLDAEIMETERRLVARRAEQYQPKYTQAIADANARLEQLGKQFNTDKRAFQFFKPGVACPTCRRTITDEALAEVRAALEKSSKETIAAGHEQRSQLKELQKLEAKAKAVFEDFQVQDVAVLEEKLAQLKEQRDSDSPADNFLAGQEGLYRHIIGGNAIEQIIDGKLSVLNNPSYDIAGITLFNTHEFLALFHNRKLVRFTYDPNIPAKPSEVLKVYSLENNDTIRQAITLYLADNPNVYIEYDIGMTGDNTVTREDALKKLNTEITAGNGPDVLIMDDLPYASYVEKGLLKDLTPTISIINNKEPLFTNIPNAMKSDDGKIYALPCEIQLPVLFGDQPVISQMNNLENLADTIDALWREHPGQDLLGIYSAEDMLRLFAMISAPSWTGKNKAINTQNISSFLEQTKRLYDAQNENFTNKQPEIYVVGTQRNSSDTLLNLKVIEYVGGYLPSFTCGILYNSHTYAEMDSINRISGFESSGWRTMNGQNNHVFIAKTLMGINSTAHNPECAEDFLQICMSIENQSNLYNGLPINRAALNDTFSSNKDSSNSNESTPDTQPYDTEFLADSEGRLISIDIYQPNEDAIAMLCTCIEDADTPYIANKVLEDAVYEQGVAYLQGDISLDEAVNSIGKKLSIYMTE